MDGFKGLIDAMTEPETGREIENWVELRHKCSPLEIFIKLQHGAEEDVKARNSLLRNGASAEFHVFAQDNYFTVAKDIRDESGNISRLASWVQFSWDENGIAVKSRQDTKGKRAFLTFTDKAQCKLRLDNEELSCWQFRKRFLEDLFFKM